MKRIAVLASVFLVVLLSPAYSANVTVIAEGVFSEYTDPDGLLPFSEPVPGTIFKIVFTYDSDTPKLAPLPQLGMFLGAISDASLMIGSDTFGIGTSTRITILNDAVGTTGGYVDLWSGSTNTDTPTGTPNQTVVEGYNLLLVSESPATPVPPLTSTDLVQPFWPNDWEIGEIIYSINLRIDNGGPVEFQKLAEAKANITSIEVVPLPAAAWLLGSALGLLGWVRRKST